jgi:hypothetical protein
MSRLVKLLISVLALALSACTSMGHHHADVREHIDFGPTEKISVCLYVDKGISEQEGRALVEEAWNQEGRLYGIEVEIAQVKQWSRPAFQMDGILAALRQERLEAPCDRIFALLGRNVGDFAWGLVGPEVLGAVIDESLTHGYAFARRATLAQIFSSPSDVIGHEIYHLLGCGEHFHMDNCYEQIARMKAWKRDNGGDFFPAWDLVNKRMLTTREDVNIRVAAVAGGAVAKR